jgi:hypothetical protein
MRPRKLEHFRHGKQRAHTLVSMFDTAVRG